MIRTGSKFIAVVMILGLLISSCSQKKLTQPAEIQHLSAHPNLMEKPLLDRISFGNEKLLAWQHKINKDYGMDVRPTLVKPDHPLLPEIKLMLAGLPPGLQRLTEKYLVALYLVENDWGTGTTEAIQDDAGNWVYGYIALNLTALDKTANEWGTWKETSGFQLTPGHELRMVLENGVENSRQSAIRFIFLHELGHVLGLGLGVHGFWDDPIRPEDSEFLKVSWKTDLKTQKAVSPWRQQYPLITKPKFYHFEKATLPISRAEEVYKDLARTDLPSLYGATNPFDDFAEAFVIYVHTKLLKKPYRVEMKQNGKWVTVYQSCITTGKCLSKVEFMDSLFRK